MEKVNGSREELSIEGVLFACLLFPLIAPILLIALITKGLSKVVEASSAYARDCLELLVDSGAIWAFSAFQFSCILYKVAEFGYLPSWCPPVMWIGLIAGFGLSLVFQIFMYRTTHQ